MTAAPTGDVEIVDDRHEVVIRRIPVGTLDTNCYAVHGHGSRRAVLIDPGGEPQRILNACSDLTVDLIVLTHTHWDHVEGLAEVHGALGAPVAAHLADAPVWPHELAHLHQHGHWDAGTTTPELLAQGCPPRPSRRSRSGPAGSTGRSTTASSFGSTD